jgi:hypothetical protein
VAAPAVGHHLRPGGTLGAAADARRTTHALSMARPQVRRREVLAPAQIS